MKKIYFLFLCFIFASIQIVSAQCSDFVMVGTAMYVGDCIEMTQATTSQVGCAWQPDKYDFTKTIDVEIAANFGDMNGGADGICMIFQIDSLGLEACGSHGGLIGAGGIDSSFIIEFDTWNNPENGDLVTDHIAVNINGDMSNSIIPPVDLGDIEDGLDHLLRFTWNPVTSSYAIYFDNVLQASGTYDIPANCFGGQTEAYYGFSSSTGGAFNNHVICPVAEYINEFFQAEICEGDTIAVKDSIYTESGQYTQMLSSETDCDTILFVNIEVLKNSSSNSGFAICEGDSIIINGEVYSEAGTYSQSFTAANGCDSTLNVNLTLFPSFEEEESYTILAGESIDINGESYDAAGNYTQLLNTMFGCDSIVHIQIKVLHHIVYQSLDSCIAVTGVSNTNYDEFTPQFPEVLACGTVLSSNIYRNNPEINMHSCTPGLNGNPTMCVGSLDDCNFDPESDKVVHLDITLTPDPDSEISLTELSFYENSPENFNWINGNSGPNNFPTLFGVAVYKNGSLIYEQSDIGTTNDFSLHSFDFTDDTDFTISEETTFNIVLLGYCLVGNGSPVAAWDLDEINLMATCDPLPGANGSISGKVANFNEIPIEGVEISRIQNKTSPMILKDFTDASGNYVFENNPGYFSYTLEAFKNNEKMQGVTTLDLLWIQKHILALQTLDAPEKWIAADINNSETITGLDILLLRKLILGIDAEFPSNRSWEFVPASEVLDLDNVWNFSTNIEIDALLEDMEALSFKAIKIGDVNDSYTTSIKGDEHGMEGRSSVALVAQEQFLSESQIYSIPFYAKSMQSLRGIQIQLHAHGLQVLDVLPGALDIDPTNFRITDSEILLSWDNLEGLPIHTNEILFRVQVKAKKAGKISAMLQLIHESFPSEVYEGSDFEPANIDLRFQNKIKSEGLTVGQNIPNPFKDETMLPIFSEQAGNCSIDFFNLNGQLLYHQTTSLEEGANEVKISAALLGAENAIILYKVQLNSAAVYGKMTTIR